MKKALKIVLSVLLAVVIAVGAYVGYAFLAYDRLDDRIELEITNAEQQADALEPGTLLRVLSYNVGFGAYSADYSFFMDGGKESRARSVEALQTNIAGANATIRQQEPDLILLQEVDTDGTRSLHINERELFQDALTGYHSVFAQNYDSPYLLWPLTSPHGANQSGIMTFSRFPITSALRRSLPIENGPMKMVDLDRCYSVSRIPVANGKELVLYNVHLSAYTSDGIIAEEQLKILFDDMCAEQENGNYTIAGGDFNKDLLGNSGEVFGVPGDDATWAQPIPPELIPENLNMIAPYDAEKGIASCRNADRPYGPDNFRVTVDGFVISKNVEHVSSHVVDTAYQWSDHNPVCLDFILK